MGAWQMARSREARRRGRMGKQEMAASGKNRIRIFGPKTDGTYIVEFPCIRAMDRLSAVRAPVPPPTQLRDAAAAPDEPRQRHRRARQLKKPCRSKSAPAAEFVRERINQWEAANDISPRTAQRYRQLAEDQIVPHLGATPYRRYRGSTSKPGTQRCGPAALPPARSATPTEYWARRCATPRKTT